MVLFLFLDYLLSLGLPVLCWIKVMMVFLHPCLLPIFREKTFSFVPLRATLEAQMVKSLLAMQETQVQSLGQEDPLEKGMATQSCILAWRIPWTEEPGRQQSMGSQRVGPDWSTNTHASLNLLAIGFLLMALFYVEICSLIYICIHAYIYIYMTSNTMLKESDDSGNPCIYKTLFFN